MDNKVYTPEVIPDNPFPTSMPTNQAQPRTISGGITGQQIIQDQPIPLPQNADNVISPRLDTKTRQILAGFTFAPTGALRIGEFAAGKSGEVDISPAGIIAKNINGDTTFALDGDTGDAVFAGKLGAGTIVTGAIEVGDTIIDKTGIKFTAGQIENNTPNSTSNTSLTSVPGSQFNIDITSEEPVFILFTVFAYLGIDDPNYQLNGYFASLNFVDLTDNNGAVMQTMSTPGVPGTYYATPTLTTRTNLAPVSQSALLLVSPGSHNFELQFAAVGGGTATIGNFNIQIVILGPQHP